jgi:hypothetical protein
VAPADPRSALPAGRLVGAMRARVRYVRYDPAFRMVLVRSGAFVSGAAGLWALLAAIACESADWGPAEYGLMLGSLGAGTVLGTLLFRAVRRGTSADVIVAARVGHFGMRPSRSHPRAAVRPTSARTALRPTTFGPLDLRAQAALLNLLRSATPAY